MTARSAGPRHPIVVVLVALVMLACACGRTDPTGPTVSGSPAGAALTVYSASGLGAWYNSQFRDFTKDTGITVNVVEGGSGELVSRVRNEQDDPQADLLVVLPPFIQQAARAGLLQPSGFDPAGISSPLIGPAAIYVPIIDNALSFIVNTGVNPRPVSWDDLLDPRFKGKLQYSTPGEAGDGTAVLLLLQHLMGKPRALNYLAKLQANNVGPAGSTGQLQPKVSSGDLLLANGDIQMNLSSIKNDGSRFDIFFPALPDNSRTTLSIPYVAGVTGASRRPAEAKRLLEFLLSEKVQQSVSTEAFGIPVLDSVAEQMAADDSGMTPTGLLKDVRVWIPDWTAVLGDLDYDIAAYTRAVSR